MFPFTGYSHEYLPFGLGYFYGNEQRLKQVKKIDQRQIQLQDQNNSNRLLMLLLSSGESLASKLNDSLKREYSSHDFGDSFENKSFSKILLQFIEQIELFESSYKRYCKTYNNTYDFPYDNKKRRGLCKEEILKDLKKWKNCVEDKYKKYYQAVIDIFYNKPIPDFADDIDNISDIDDYGKEDKCNPKELREVYPVLLEQINTEKMQIADDYSKNKDLKIVINKKEKNNNNEYGARIKSKLAKIKEDTKYPDKAKRNIKFNPITQFDNIINIPDFITKKIKQKYYFEQNIIDSLYNWLYNYKSDNLFNILNDFFFKCLKYKRKQTSEIINYITDEIYKELIFDYR